MRGRCSIDPTLDRRCCPHRRTEQGNAGNSGAGRVYLSQSHDWHPTYPEHLMSITNPPLNTPSAAEPQVTGWATLGLLNRYHWFVFLVASTAWMLDCMDQQFFTLARNSAMNELVTRPTESDRRVEDFARNKFDPPKDPSRSDDLKEVLAKIHAADVGDWSGRATSAFLIGWALGGLGFGIMGDRMGRVKTLSLTILIYALFT